PRPLRVDEVRLDAERAAEDPREVDVVADDRALVAEDERRIGRFHADPHLAALLELLEGDGGERDARPVAERASHDGAGEGGAKQVATAHRLQGHGVSRSKAVTVTDWGAAAEAV